MAFGAPKTIGLISTIGDSFTVKTVGATLFDNEEKTFPVAEWRLNERIAASVSNILRKNYKVKWIQGSPNALEGLGGQLRTLRASDEEFSEALRSAVGTNRADYYLVITSSNSAFGTTDQTLKGLGLTRTEGVFGTGGGDYLHALTEMRVYDSQLKLLRSADGTIGQDSFLATVKGPYQKLDDSKRLPGDPRAIVGDPRARDLSLKLLEKSLAATLPKLFDAN
jgi:hypothetical protein